MSKGNSQLFSIAIFAFFLIELFSPLAFASSYYNLYDDSGVLDGKSQQNLDAKPFDPKNPPAQKLLVAKKPLAQKLLFAEAEAAATVKPEVTYEGTCSLAVMDAAEVARYQQGLSNFQAEQISTLNNAALRKNDPLDKNAQNINININLADQPRYPIKDIAGLLEYDEKQREDLAKEYNIDKDSGLMTLEQVKAVSTRLPGGADKLSKLLGISSAGEIPKAPYENFKVVLPEGKSVALSDLMKVQPQEKENSCLLDRSFIQGKVTFNALLNKDLFVGFDQSKTTVKAQQHLTAKQTTAALNNYAGSMLVPKMYERYVTTVGQWSTYEEWASLAGAASILFAREGVNGIKREIQDSKDSFERLKGASGGIGDSPRLEEIRARQLLLDSRIEENEKLMRQIDFETSVHKWKPVAIALYGAGWMGAARIALSASNQILFSSLVTSDKKLKDNYMQIYVNNNNFLTDFRRATDFFGTGKITDWASDLMEAGAPTKAFETGNVMFLTRDTTPDAQISESSTSFETDGSGWQIKMDWKGRSENSLFEDIRKNSEYTSFALNSNNLELGTTIKNSEEFAKYYQGIAVLAPLVNFVIYRRADMQYLTGPVSALIRSGTFDFVVTRFVDPVRFSKDELCDEKEVDSFLNYYRIFTAVSIIDSSSTVLFPSKSLLEVLGGTFKAKFVNNFASKNAKGTKFENFFSTANKDQIIKLNTEIGELRTKSTTALTERLYAIKSLREAEGINNPTLLKQLENQVKVAGDNYDEIASEIVTESKKLSELKLPKGPELKYSTMENAVSNLYKAVVLLDPIQLGKQVVASNGFRYVSLCKDTSYKILGYQKLSNSVAGQNLDQKFNQLGKIDLGGKLNLTSALGGIGQKVEEKSLTELLNLRAYMDDPYGQLNPYEIYYIHLDGATSQWFGVYNKLKANGCFRECHDSKDGFVCVDETGVTYTDKKTGKAIKLSQNKDRGLMSLLMQDLARTLIPNKIITAGLDNACYDREMLRIEPSLTNGRTGGNLLILDDSCDTIKCLRTQLKSLKPDITSDLTASGFGEVRAIYTDKGRITANDGKIRFLQSITDDEDESGEIQAPSLAALEEKKLESLLGNFVSIKGNGDVTIKGYIKDANSRDEIDAGKLLTIITENGKIELDEAGGRLVVALYVLSKVKPLDSISGFGTKVTKNTDQNGKDVPAIALDNAQPKIGGEAAAKELNDALKKIQTDANGKVGGMQVFETDKYRYTIGTDENGKQTLTVYDKTTGEKKEFQITGPLRKEGNDIIIPTDKGDFKFTLDMQNGVPKLSAQGPDGFKELLATLLAAKGPGGMIAFDPRTGLWYALNGQDIPWNDEFAKRGLSLYNTPDGTRGLPADNLLTYPRKGSSYDPYSSPISIPSFPENNYLAFALMLGAIVVGVFAVRIRRIR
ncbi:hypothetical protein HY989_00220 [Candidatus Micrarchaeota archaeon]|nr:hypothetical protein [Candidatus Micrarchaeota archaeon]